MLERVRKFFPGRKAIICSYRGSAFHKMGLDWCSESPFFLRTIQEIDRVLGGSPNIQELICYRPAEDFYPIAVAERMIFAMNIANAVMLEDDLEDPAFLVKNTVLFGHPVSCAWIAHSIDTKDALRVIDAQAFSPREIDHVEKVLETVNVKNPRFTIMDEGKSIRTSIGVRLMLARPLPETIDWEAGGNWLRRQRRVRQTLWCGPGDPPEGIVYTDPLLPWGLYAIAGVTFAALSVGGLYLERKRREGRRRQGEQEDQESDTTTQDE